MIDTFWGHQLIAKPIYEAYRNACAIHLPSVNLTHPYNHHLSITSPSHSRLLARSHTPSLRLSSATHTPSLRLSSATHTPSLRLSSATHTPSRSIVSFTSSLDLTLQAYAYQPPFIPENCNEAFDRCLSHIGPSTKTDILLHSCILHTLLYLSSHLSSLRSVLLSIHH